MNEDLKPCPFCGGSASIEQIGNRGQSTIYRCDNCSCSLETAEEFKVGRVWNTRASISAEPKADNPAPGSISEWQPIAVAPKDKTRVIIAVPTEHRDDWIIGEASFDPEHYGDGDWWWAGNDAGDYHGGPISEIQHHAPEFWQPLPAPPAKAEATNG